MGLDLGVELAAHHRDVIDRIGGGGPPGGRGRRRRAAGARALYAGLVAWQAALHPAGAAAADRSETPRRGVVARVVDGDTVVLASGRQLRLVGIQAPKLALGRPGFRAWPLAGEARAALDSLVAGRPVALDYDGRRTDRHRRLLAHLRVAAPGGGETVWVQAEMLARGLARVYSFADNRKRAAELLGFERAARAAGRGIWAHPFYRILGPDETGASVGTFQIVEGRVLDASIVGGRGYLNFGPDWRTDFTVSIAPRHVARFRRAGLDPAALSGRRIRVRGWLHRFNGPMMEATHPEQLEVADR